MERFLDRMDVCRSRCPTWMVTRKCCFCVPIRIGILIFGYVSLIFGLLIFPIVLYLLVAYHGGQEEDQDYVRSLVEPTIHLPITTAFLIIGVAMDVMLLVGTHRKKKVLLKIYFYSNLVLSAISIVVDIIFFDSQETYTERTMYIISAGFNCYLLFLVYCTFHLLEESSEVKYVAYRETRNLITVCSRP